jgi:hypothetical protein
MDLVNVLRRKRKTNLALAAQKIDQYEVLSRSVYVPV